MLFDARELCRCFLLAGLVSEISCNTFVQCSEEAGNLFMGKGGNRYQQLADYIVCVSEVVISEEEQY